MKIFIIIIVIVIILVLICKFMIKPKTACFPPGYTQENIDTEMNIVTTALNKCIIKCLYTLCNTNYTFSRSTSGISEISAGNYKGIVNALIRPDVYIDENQTTFFNAFLTKVYLLYISETSNTIKSIYFKFYSGYTIDTYKNTKNKEKPSVLPFISEYVRMYIWKLSIEITDYDKKISDETTDNSHINLDLYTNKSERFNENKYKELCLSYYNLYNTNKENTEKEDSKTKTKD